MKSISPKILEDILSQAMEVANDWLADQWSEGEPLIEIGSVSASVLQITDDSASVFQQIHYKEESKYL